jgi:hypothetical protein
MLLVALLHLRARNVSGGPRGTGAKCEPNDIAHVASDVNVSATSRILEIRAVRWLPLSMGLPAPCIRIYIPTLADPAQATQPHRNALMP